jgi:multidrug resistance efflux pump
MNKYLGLLLGVLMLAGCGGEPTEATAPTDEAVAGYQRTEKAVVVEAVIEPAHWGMPGFDIDGEVIEVLVKEGDAVAAGDLLVRLNPTDAQLAVRRAEAALDIAQAELALLQADPRVEEVAATEAQLESALATLAQASAQWDQLITGATEAEIAAAEAEVASAMRDQKLAEHAHNDATLGPAEEQARHRLHAANEALVAAQAQLDQVLAGADANERRAAQANVSSATAQQGAMQAQLDLLNAGATPEEIAVAEAAVTEAKVAAESAQATLAQTEVRAPFAGTVTAVNVEVGNIVGAGQVACTLATLDQLRARTTELTELDVGHIVEGQPATVTVDALPGREFTGVVRQIALQAERVRGRVVYAATVELTNVADIPPRWGMTARVRFEAP